MLKQPILSFIVKFTIYSLCLLLGACTTLTAPVTIRQGQPPPAETAGDYTVREYDALAAQAPPHERAYYRLLATEQVLSQGDSTAALKRFAQIDSDRLSIDNLARYQLLDAQLTLAQQQYALVLRKLPAEVTSLTQDQKIRYYATQATAMGYLGYSVQSIQARIAMDNLLTPEQQRDNHRAIWSSFESMSSQTLAELSQLPADKTLQGWAQLAQSLRALPATASQNQRKQTVLQWQRRYPKHPAATTSVMDYLNALTNLQYPQNIALLLPITGRFANAAASVHKGFLAAHYSAQGNSQIRVYDTGEEAEQIPDLVRQAVKDGAEVIVGPLDKQSVDQLTRLRNSKVPILALNYADGSLGKRLFQYGLLPEDEVKQIAELAVLRGQMRVATLTPNTAFGRRLEQAFKTTFTQLSGRVVASQSYRAKDNDHKNSIKQLLNLQYSQSRYDRLRNQLNIDLEFTPQIRTDVDAIIMIADPGDARLLKPQLKYYNAGDIPVYATSQIFSGQVRPGLDQDLNNITFVDTPWTANTGDYPLYEELNTLWPVDMARNPRLFAFGIDAYQLIPHLPRLSRYPYERYMGATGALSLDLNNQLHRELTWQQFKRGQPEAINVQMQPNMSHSTQ